MTKDTASSEQAGQQAQGPLRGTSPVQGLYDKATTGSGEATAKAQEIAYAKDAALKEQYRQTNRW